MSYPPESTAARTRLRLARSARKAFISETAFGVTTPRTFTTAVRTSGMYLSVPRRAFASSAWNIPGWRLVATQTRLSALSTGSVSCSAVTLGPIVVVIAL